MTCIARRNRCRIASFRTTAATRTLLAGAVALASVLPALPAQATPAGGVVAAGAGVITQQGATTTINQSATQPQGLPTWASTATAFRPLPALNGTDVMIGSNTGGTGDGRGGITVNTGRAASRRPCG